MEEYYKKMLVLFFLMCLVVEQVNLQRVQGRHIRPYQPENCDRYGRCVSKDEYDDVKDDFKSDNNKERKTELTRDDWPVGRPGVVSGEDYDLKPVGGGDKYVPKPTIDVDEHNPKQVGSGGGGYNPKPVAGKDDYIPSTSTGGGGYNRRPPSRPDYNPKPVVTGGGGGYNRKPAGSGSEDYNPKPVTDRDDYDIKPVGGGGGGGGGYNPKPTVNRDEYDPKPVGTGGGRYNPRPATDKDDLKPVRGGGGYYPKPDVDDYVRRPDRKDLGGYDNPKDDYYNDYDSTKDDEYTDDLKPVPVVDGNCICVPYYQCEDGHIVTDGAGIIDARKRPDPDAELPLDGKFKPPSCGPFHVCCNTPETSTVKPYEHRCGVRNPSGINSRILSPSNKGEADFGEWPWQAAVLKAEGKVNIFQCGGVLIDKYHVLTVAHCVFHLYTYNEYPLKVRLGEWDTQTTTEFLAHEDYKVSKIIVHPEYKNTSLWNDIAILRLETPVLFAPHIDTICLPQYDEIFAGQNCVVTGWGKDAYKGGTFSNVMKEVALQVIDNYKCEEMMRKTRLGRFFQLHEGFLCAGGEYGLDSCKGDGGGPLVCYRKDKSYALAGIVSWGIDCGQPGVPGVYVKIQKYLDWISKNTGVTLQEYWPKH